MELKIRKSTFLTIQNDTNEIFVQHIQILFYSTICRSYYSCSCLKVPIRHSEFGDLGFMGLKVVGFLQVNSLCPCQVFTTLTLSWSHITMTWIKWLITATYLLHITIIGKDCLLLICFLTSKSLPVVILVAARAKEGRYTIP